MDAQGYTEARAVNGVLTFATSGRPDLCGQVSVLSSGIGRNPETGAEPTFDLIARGNEVLQYAIDTQKNSSLYYMPLAGGYWPEAGKPCSFLRLLVISLYQIPRFKIC